MKRRDFITLMAGAALAGALAARAQPSKPPRLGVLVLGNPDPGPFMRSFQEGLRDLGYHVGQNIVMELRSAGGDVNLLRRLAAELVLLKVDVLVAYQTPAAQAAKNATTEIPIVIVAGDPVGTGLVASLARPEGNITGLSGTTAELAAKSLELIRELLPSARRIGILVNTTDPFAKSFLELVELAAPAAGVELLPFMIDGPEKLEPAFVAMREGRAGAVIIQPSLLHQAVFELTRKYRLPSLSPSRAFAEGGGLMAYSAKLADLHRETAAYVDKILKGRKPADLPVMQPNKFELLINLKTAKALGLDVPPALVVRADEVIE
jgi:putative ABC transport system substrate-binding protein